MTSPENTRRDNRPYRSSVEPVIGGQVEVTEQVETVEWVCRPLLAETAPQ